MPRMIRLGTSFAQKDAVIGEDRDEWSSHKWVATINQALERGGNPPQRSAKYCRLWMAGWTKWLKAQGRRKGPVVRVPGRSWSPVSTVSWYSHPMQITDENVDHLPHA